MQPLIQQLTEPPVAARTQEEFSVGLKEVLEQVSALLHQSGGSTGAGGPS